MKNITIKTEANILEAFRVLEKTSLKCLVVEDDNQRFLGTLTDGDLRRWILSGADFNTSIKDSYCKNPHVLQENKFTKEQASELMIQHGVELLPILDEKRRIVDILTWGQVFGKKDKLKDKIFAVPVIIMAGGKGTRLEPFTQVLPKPLIPIHGKPVIQHIIESFTTVGVNDFYLMVNYKSSILKAFFDELQPDYFVHFVDEQEPLGTAGGLKFMEGKFKEPFLVSNCDIIINIDYADLYDFHNKNEYDITLVASMKNFAIPYGICELNSNGCLDHIKEKPEYKFLFNTGLYVLNPKVLTYIPKEKLYHITELIVDAKKDGKKVGVYPIAEEAWNDIGQWAEYRQAVDRL